MSADRDPIDLDIAVRAYPADSPIAQPIRREAVESSGLVVAVDVESRVGRVDLSQRLLFGSYRVYAPGNRLVEEGLIAADDLTESERQILEGYIDGH